MTVPLNEAVRVEEPLHDALAVDVALSDALAVEDPLQEALQRLSKAERHTANYAQP